MHSLLSRQLRKHLGIKDEVPAELKAFIAAVDAGYSSMDNQRALLERSLELSSQELSEANERVRVASEEIALKNKRLEALSSKLAKAAGLRFDLLWQARSEDYE
jgi:hypothetical protein